MSSWYTDTKRARLASCLWIIVDLVSSPIDNSLFVRHTKFVAAEAAHSCNSCVFSSYINSHSKLRNGALIYVCNISTQNMHYFASLIKGCNRKYRPEEDASSSRKSTNDASSRIR